MMMYELSGHKEELVELSRWDLDARISKSLDNLCDFCASDSRRAHTGWGLKPIEPFLPICCEVVKFSQDVVKCN